MRPTIVVSPQTGPDDALAWAQYGAAQALTMLGVSFEVATAAELQQRQKVTLLIYPSRYMATAVRGKDVREPLALGATSQFLRVTHIIGLNKRGRSHSLPCLGLPDAPQAPSYVTPLLLSDDGSPGGAVFQFERHGDSLICGLQCHVFATIGLYLSRFSWEGNPVADGSFVRQIDALWDHQLAALWGGVPVVHEYLHLIEEALAALYDELKVPYVRKWQHPIRRGTICTHGLLLTHDVDAVYAEARFRESGASQLPGEAELDPLDPPCQRENGWFNFQRWADLESRLGVRSAFFFLSPDPSLTYWCSPGYNIADPAVAAAARRLAQLGWEVSVHQLGYDEQKLLDAERARFLSVTGVAPRGTRSHYLKHVPHTLAHKAASGLVYDSTWYAETTESSFLCGTTLPFAPFGLAAPGQPTPLWEFPFVVEDGIIFGVYGENQPRNVGQAFEEGRKALEEVLALNGYVCLNAHQRTFAAMSSQPGAPDDWTPAYERLVRYMQANSPHLWSPLPRELAVWWGARERISVEPSQTGIVVTNEGANPIGDLVLCRLLQEDDTPTAMWRRFSDSRCRQWLARPIGMLTPGETRTIHW